MKPQDLIQLEHLQPVLEQAANILRIGGKVWFKWTCIGCGSRQTFETENTLHSFGKCEECNHVSDIGNPEVNLGLMVMVSSPREREKEN